MLEQLWAAKHLAQSALFILLFALALARGAAPERILAGTIPALLVYDHLYHAALHGGSLLWRHTDMGHVLGDTTALAVTVVVALRANRVYPLWIGAAQVIAVSAHLYRFSMSEIDRFAYDMMQFLPSYIQLVAIALGLGFHMSRQKRLGSYPSWSRSSPRTAARAPRPSRGC